MRTCKVCGTRTQTERHKNTHEPENCPPDVVDHRGSTKDIKRTFCVKCHTYIHEQPAILASGKKDTAKKVEQAPNMQAEVIERF